MRFNTIPILVISFLFSLVAAELVPFDNTVVNSCNGETVVITGQLNVVLKDRVFHINTVNVQGVGDLGNHYTVAQTLRVHFDGDTGASVVQSGLVLNVVSHGAAPNFKVHTIFHSIFTPSGNLNSFSDFTSSCT